ncbi:MAG: hypothetical protein IH984_14955 [Planctomycetes bacterium]|nr:hypothetical protein [Planctomycetota bacterium]
MIFKNFNNSIRDTNCEHEKSSADSILYPKFVRGMILHCFSGFTLATRKTSLSIVLVLAILFGVFGFNPNGTIAAQNVADSYVAKGNTEIAIIGPTADLMDDLLAILLRMIQDLEDAEEVIDGGAGPLTGADKALVVGLLDHVEEHIDQVFNSVKDPNLSPVDAGSIDYSFGPYTLADHAADSVDLALDAMSEFLSQNPSDDVIGTKLKTIKNLLSSYRSEAGI